MGLIHLPMVSSHESIMILSHPNMLSCGVLIPTSEAQLLWTDDDKIAFLGMSIKCKEQIQWAWDYVHKFESCDLPYDMTSYKPRLPTARVTAKHILYTMIATRLKPSVPATEYYGWELPISHISVEHTKMKPYPYMLVRFRRSIKRKDSYRLAIQYVEEDEVDFWKAFLTLE